MRQAVLVEPKHIEFREVEAPKASDLKEHQVLLNIKLSLIHISEPTRPY